MRFVRNFFVALLCLSCFQCTDLDDSEGLEIISLSYDFNNGLQGWTADFTDYPVGETLLSDTIYRWTAETAPSPKDGSNSIKLSCENPYGDIFMFIKRKVSALRPNTTYTVVYDIELASNITSGQGLVLKAGGSELEPKKVIENDYYTLNLDKGDDFSSGENLIAFGDIGLSTEASYAVVNRGNANSYSPLIVRSNSKGELWLIVGTESLYSGTNYVYYTRLNVILSVSG
jgi:hypothetical protein